MLLFDTRQLTLQSTDVNGLVAGIGQLSSVYLDWFQLTVSFNSLITVGTCIAARPAGSSPST